MHVLSKLLKKLHHDDRLVVARLNNGGIQEVKPEEGHSDILHGAQCLQGCLHFTWGRRLGDGARCLLLVRQVKVGGDHLAAGEQLDFVDVARGEQVITKGAVTCSVQQECRSRDGAGGGGGDARRERDDHT